MVQKRVKPEEMIETKFFTLSEIEIAITKLNRRCKELKDLLEGKTRYNDSKVSTVEFKIKETIRETFGQYSPEFKEHSNFEIYTGPFTIVSPFDPNSTRRQEQTHQDVFLREGLPDAIQVINGLVDWLDEKRLDLLDSFPVQTYEIFKGLNIHPRVRSASETFFKDAHYSTAIFEASKALVNLVKEKSDRPDLDGDDLMNKVFNDSKPILSFIKNENSQSDKDEQKGMMFLYKGLVSAIRNPKAHNEMTNIKAPDRDRALEYIAFISLLAKRLDDAFIASN